MNLTAKDRKTIGKAKKAIEEYDKGIPLMCYLSHNEIIEALKLLLRMNEGDKE